MGDKQIRVSVTVKIGGADPLTPPGAAQTGLPAYGLEPKIPEIPVQSVGLPLQIARGPSGPDEEDVKKAIVVVVQ